MLHEIIVHEDLFLFSNQLAFLNLFFKLKRGQKNEHNFKKDSMRVKDQKKYLKSRLVVQNFKIALKSVFFPQRLFI